MTRITQEQFKNDFKRNGVDVAIDVKNLDPETEEKLKKAGVSQAALNEITGIDGKISGDKEYTLLYKKVDSFEKDKPTTPGYFETTDAKNAPTKSGQVYEALKGEVDRNLNIARAQGVLQNSPAVSGNDPHKKHVTEVRAKLQKEGLPVSAKGVTVMVIGEGDTAHSQAITRTIAGKVGLAQGADVHVPDDGGHRDKYVNNHRYTDELNKKGKSTLSVDDLAKIGIVKMEAALYAAREEIGTIRKNLPADGKMRIGSISWGANSPLGMASEAVGKLGHKDPIMKTAELEWAMKNKVKFDRTDPSHVIGARVHLTEKIAGEIKKLQNDKTNQENFKNLKTGLENELAEARKKGLLVINAAGNDHEVANALGDPKSSTIIFDSIKGLVTVGATDLRTPKNAKMWEGSAEGKSIEIAAPGVELPVGVENNRTTKETGTSFAAPYVASVAALMIKANPKITPDQIEAILTSGRVTVDLAAGDRDGTGLLDPVKAVKEAKKLLSTR